MDTSSTTEFWCPSDDCELTSKTMDPCTIAQDVPRCDLCETAIIHSYCVFCNVNLCKLCIGEHISDGYEKHKIVPFQDRKSTLIYPKCEMHPQKTCEFQCKDCNSIFVCSSCMASEQHRGHIFLEVSVVYKERKTIVENDIEKLENLVSNTLEETQVANLEGIYETLTAEITTHGEKWHKEIDIIINKMKSEISEIKMNHRDILQKQMNDIKQKHDLMKQALLELRKLKESNEVCQTIKYSSRIKEFSRLPPDVKVTPPTFKPGSIDSEKMYSFFGQITPLSMMKRTNYRRPYRCVMESND